MIGIYIFAGFVLIEIGALVFTRPQWSRALKVMAWKKQARKYW